MEPLMKIPSKSEGQNYSLKETRPTFTMTLDELEEALSEKVVERVSPFREKVGQLIIGDCFKYLKNREPNTLWLVVSIDYPWSIVKAVRYLERYECPTLYNFDFSEEIVRYKLV